MIPDILAVPRKRAFFEPSEGEFIPINGARVPDALKIPHVRVDRGGTTQGLESGYRSGLLFVEGEWYKIKGCRPSSKDHHGEPFGTQTFSDAQKEENDVLVRGAMYRGRGYEYPLEPRGFWKYDHIQFEGEPTAGTIYRIAGDTRLDEFLRWAERAPLHHLPLKNRREIKGVMNYLGTTSGELMRLLHQNHFTWDQDKEDASNAHTGNVILFPGQNGLLRTALIDFDNSLTYPPDRSSNGLPKEDEVQARDLRTFRDWLKSPVSVSGSAVRSWDPRETPLGLIRAAIKRGMPMLSDDNFQAVQAFLLAELHPTNFVDLSRMALMKSFYEAYRSTSSRAAAEIPWADVVGFISQLSKFRKGFSQKSARLLNGRNRVEFLMDVKGQYFFIGYPHPVVVSKATVDMPPSESSESDWVNPAETLIRVASILSGHESSVGSLPDKGISFFEFPPLSQPLAEQYANLKPGDIKNIAHLWISGLLQKDLVKSNSPRAIGAFLLGLVQTHAFAVGQAVNQVLVTQLRSVVSTDDLSRADELLKLIPGRALLGNDLGSYLRKNGVDVHRSLSLVKEVGLKSALNLFSLGLITRDLYEIFNHMMHGVILNGFDARHLQALQAARQCIEVVDPRSEGGTKSLILIALTAAEIRAGKSQLSVLESEGDQVDSKFLLYLYASLPKSAISDPEVAEILNRPVNEQSLVFVAEELIREGAKMDPDSAYAKQLKSGDIQAADIISLMKMALDISGGDLTKIDPVLLSCLKRAHYSGEVKAKDASELILACVGLGVDLPELILRSVIEENQMTFLDILASDEVIRNNKKYETLSCYPIHPIHAFLSKGLSVLPRTVRKLYDESKNQPGVSEALALGILRHLFIGGYYFNYFKGSGGYEGYPDPAMNIKDISATPSSWEIWRIVHPDIWDIVSLVDPDIVKQFIEEKLSDRKINVGLIGRESGRLGFCDCTFTEAFPPSIYGNPKYKFLLDP